MRSAIWKTGTLRLLTVTLLIFSVSCGGGQSVPRSQTVPPTPFPQVRTETMKDEQGTTWIPLYQAAGILGLRLRESDKSAQIGYTDVMFEVKPSQKQAMSYGHPVTMPQAPSRVNGRYYLTADSLSTLLQAKIRLDPRNGSLLIGRISDSLGTSEKSPQQGVKNRYGILGITGNEDKMVSYAKQFLGVPYTFGAAPYEQSKTFDCSSFTQFVFKKFGVKLPRLAKDQAHEGIPVAKSNLQVGDLIFFTVPGRFESDKIAGHVGIYIGNGQMIHTWGDPGVEISSIESGHWHDVLLSIRRVG